MYASMLKLCVCLMVGIRKITRASLPWRRQKDYTHLYQNIKTLEPPISSGWHSYTFTTWIAVDTTKNCRLQSWTLHKSADCRWISTTILYVSFTNSATVRRLEQVQLCNRLIDQSADNITGLKCAKECLILKYKYIQNPCPYPPPKCVYLLIWLCELLLQEDNLSNDIPIPK